MELFPLQVFLRSAQERITHDQETGFRSSRSKRCKSQKVSARHSCEQHKGKTGNRTRKRKYRNENKIVG